MSFDFLAIGDAAAALGIPKNTLRYYCDMGKVKVRRVSDGSRIVSPTDLERARVWLREYQLEKAREREIVAKNRALKARIENRNPRRPANAA